MDVTKVRTPAEVLESVGNYGSRRLRVVLTNGCFDILHVGHIRYLRAARSLGECLVVGLNSDASVRLLKGPQRPICTQDDRAEMLSALACVDFVTLFDENSAEQLVSLLQPDVYVKGADYAPESSKDIPEAAIVEAYGGRVELIPLVEDQSTTAIIERIVGKKESSV